MNKKFHGHTLLSALFLLFLITTSCSFLYSKYKNIYSLRKSIEQHTIAKMMVLILKENHPQPGEGQLYQFSTGRVITHQKENIISYQVTLNNSQTFQFEDSHDS
ncbi:MAG: hypothetical protein LBT69_04415 [Lactobacillales bacterium]|nr:hypothetical protein [Lactobacillales bacterium]